MTQLEQPWTTAVVRSAFEPASDVRALDLVPSHGVTSYPLGSHVEVQVPLADRTAVRCYSLVGQHPHDGAYRIAVKRVTDSRGGSRYMWNLPPGAALRISEPRSHFELRAGRPEYLLIAGGIGITPLLGMAEALAQREARFRLIYAGRARAGMAFLPALSAQLGSRLSVFASDEGARLDLAREIAVLHPQGELYVCGPIKLLETARRAWREAGRAASQLRIETFGTSGHGNTRAFEVFVADHHVELAVARDQSLLEALAGAGIEVPGHCRRGECGLCAVRIVELSGELDHRDVFLDDEQKAEGRTICPCVSRVIGRLAIDTGYREVL